MARAASVSASLMSLISKAFAPNGILTRDNSLICCSTLNRRFAPHNNSGILFCARSPIHLENITASSRNAVLRSFPCRFCNQRRKRQLCDTNADRVWIPRSLNLEWVTRPCRIATSPEGYRRVPGYQQEGGSQRRVRFAGAGRREYRETAVS